MNKKPISIDPEVLGGTAVFAGTRVPIQALFDYLEGGETLDEFLDDFPTVSKKQAMQVLKITRNASIKPKGLNENTARRKLAEKAKV